jgi:hypothetical protein
MVAERSKTVGNDRHLADGVHARQGRGDQGMSHLVTGDAAALGFADNAAALFQTGDDPLDRDFEVDQCDGLAAAPGRRDRRLIGQVGEVRAGKPRGHARDRVQIESRRKGDLCNVHLEDRHASLAVGTIHQNLPVETAGAQQRRVQDLGPVGGGEQDHPAAGIEAVDLGEQLVERLLFFVQAADRQVGPAAAQGVQFVDEDDARRLGFGLLEEVPHARGANAHEHLHELRAGDREERHAGFPRDRPGQQGLAGPRRANQQDALRRTRAQTAEPARVLQEGDGFLQFLLGFIDAGDIVEGHLDVGLGVEPSA